MLIWEQVADSVCIISVRLAPACFVSFQSVMGWSLELPPHHLVDYPHITLNNLHNLRADIFIDIVRYWNAVVTVSAELDSSVNCLEERLGIDAGDDEVGFIDGLRPLSRGAYADSRERMAYAGEERRLLREST